MTTKNKFNSSDLDIGIKKSSKKKPPLIDDGFTTANVKKQRKILYALLNNNLTRVQSYQTIKNEIRKGQKQKLNIIHEFFNNPAIKYINNITWADVYKKPISEVIALKTIKGTKIKKYVKMPELSEFLNSYQLERIDGRSKPVIQTYFFQLQTEEEKVNTKDYINYLIKKDLKKKITKDIFNKYKDDINKMMNLDLSFYGAVRDDVKKREGSTSNIIKYRGNDYSPIETNYKLSMNYFKFLQVVKKLHKDKIIPVGSTAETLIKDKELKKLYFDKVELIKSTNNNIDSLMSNIASSLLLIKINHISKNGNYNDVIEINPQDVRYFKSDENIMLYSPYTTYSINKKASNINDMFIVPTNDYLTKNYKINECFYSAIIETFQESFNKRYVKNKLTYEHIFSICHENEKYDITKTYGATFQEVKLFFEKYKLKLTVLSYPEYNKIYEYIPDSINKHMSNSMYCISHNNHIYLCNDNLRSIHQKEIDDKEKTIMEENKTGNYKIMDTTTNYNKFMNDINDLIKIDYMTIKQNVINVVYSGDLDELLFRFVYDMKLNPKINFKAGRKVISLGFKVEDKTIIIINPDNKEDEPNNNNIFDETYYNEYKKLDNMTYESVINKKYMSSYNNDLFDTLRGLLPVGLCGEIEKWEDNNIYDEDKIEDDTMILKDDVSKAYSSILMNMDNIPIFNEFDNFELYNNEDIEECNFYIVNRCSMKLKNENLEERPYPKYNETMTEEEKEHKLHKRLLKNKEIRQLNKKHKQDNILIRQEYEKYNLLIKLLYPYKQNLTTGKTLLNDTVQKLLSKNIIKINSVCKCSKVIKNDCNEAIKNVYLNEKLDMSDKKFICNKNIGMFGKMTNKFNNYSIYKDIREAKTIIHQRLNKKYETCKTNDYIKLNKVVIDHNIDNKEYQHEEITFNNDIENKYKSLIRNDMNNGDYIFNIKRGDTILYFVNTFHTDKLRNGFLPVEVMIYDTNRLNVYNRALELKTHENKIISVKTDCIYLLVNKNNKYDEQIKNDSIHKKGAPVLETLGRFYMEHLTDSDNIPTNKIYDRVHKAILKEQTILNDININNEYDINEFFKIFDTTNNIFIDALNAGSGKSYILSNYCKNKIHKFITPYNLQSIEMKNEAKERNIDLHTSTLYNFLGLSVNEDKEAVKNAVSHDEFYKTLEVVVFDEIANYGVNDLSHIKKFIDRYPHIKYFSTGDFNQNKPINDTTITDYKTYYKNIVYSIFPNKITLKLSKRLKTDEDRNKLNTIKEMIFNESIPIKKVIDKMISLKYIKTTIINRGFGISYLNDTSFKVNKNENDKYINDNSIKYKVVNDYKLYNGLVLRCRTYFIKKGIKFFTNYIYTIDKIKQETNEIELYDPLIPEKHFNISFDDIKNFSYNMAGTCHSCQGLTKKGDITIYDTHLYFINREWFYTAITRTDDLNKIFIYNKQ
jgi:hypothetical protein